MTRLRCDCCGTFRSASQLATMGGENDEEWTECVACMSDFDLGRLGLHRPRCGRLYYMGDSHSGPHYEHECQCGSEFIENVSSTESGD